MFERFTDRARRVLVLAQEEARLLQHSFIGTEHILLGLVAEGEGLAAKALESLDISLEAVREKVDETISPGERGRRSSSRHDAAEVGSPPFTPRAKKVLELSLREALQLGHNYIGTEHILLGVVREGDGVAAQVLVQLGAELPRVRQTVTQLLMGPPSPSESATGLRAGLVRGPQYRREAQGDPPYCPACGSGLEGLLRFDELAAQREDPEAEISVVAVYCGGCGIALGWVNRA